MITSAVRVAFLDFWPGFSGEEFGRRFPVFDHVFPDATSSDPRQADLVVFSCFPDGRRSTHPRDPAKWAGTRGVRLFYTAENVTPDWATCDYAMSFCRDIPGPRHLRVPNYLGTQRLYGFAADALLHPPVDPAAVRRSKVRFCTYVQRHQVPFREEFVRALSEYRRVDCAGPSLNNTGFVADRRRKYDLYRESKFAVTFENEASIGYTTEKMPDALLANCVPIYWGDPTVTVDFDSRCFLDWRDYPSTGALVARIAELDQDDDAYEAMLGAPRLRSGDVADPDLTMLRAWLETIRAELERRPPEVFEG